MSMQLFVLSFVISLMTTDAAMGFGNCHGKVPPVGNFNVTKYSGTWYEIYRDRTVPYELNSECVTATYGFDENNSEYPITVCNRADGKDCFVKARARFDSDGNGKVKFNWYPEGNYQVLATDYDSFSLVYGCDQFGSFPVYTHQAWILARERTLNMKTVRNIERILKGKVGFYDWDYYKLRTEQGDDCTYVF